MSKLAILGGKPLRTKGCPPWPQYSDGEMEFLKEVLQSRKWFAGARGGDHDSMVTRFGNAFATLHEARYGLPVMNCSIALELALRCLGVGPGDEVIVPAVTFISTATSVAQVNAIPVVVDIELNSYCMDPVAMEASITPRTKAIIPVHFAGQVADMKSIKRIADRRGLAVVEDAAQAIDSVRWGQHAGTFGALGCFSFQSNKTITSGEGGLITANSDELSEQVISLRSFGRHNEQTAGGLLSAMYSWTLSGNYRMTEFQAAVLLAQLKRFPEQNRTRQSNAALLGNLLSNIPGVYHVRDDNGLDQHGYYYFLIRYNQQEFGHVNCDVLVRALNAEGIPCHRIEPPIYRHPVFMSDKWPPKGCPFACPHYNKEVLISGMGLPISEECYNSTIVLRHQVFLGGASDIEDIANAFVKIRDHLHDLRRISEE